MDMARETGDEETEIERERSTENEPDLLPEYCHYRDDGCEFADSCLNCPFPKCLYDEPRGRQRWLKELRDREIDRLFSEGWGVKDLATLLGLSQRTIQRALKSTLSVSSSKGGGGWIGEKKLNEGELRVDE
jgi:DNA-binding transcriptional ArsR family regulator